eukprot:CAMPEP_0172744508 /NCGR_PEP_ID=MMETSP1074-20121228/135386_1 /TAXON_ID=2916 /ORGANISM="Ceratium fusus, Strain PA161109" /LENGTH=54 /DNA_ID=CAMNT_0013575481 /DNA_START=102 /DNA_END=263 /DNA_ORIENTATION=-
MESQIVRTSSGRVQSLPDQVSAPLKPSGATPTNRKPRSYLRYWRHVRTPSQSNM